MQGMYFKCGSNMETRTASKTERVAREPAYVLEIWDIAHTEGEPERIHRFSPLRFSEINGHLADHLEEGLEAHIWMI